jgi:hypothetical protein
MRGVYRMKLFIRNKKGSLSLSMEAIVILILAIVMLGLGLTFVRSMFSNIQNRANQALEVGDLTNKPTEADPVVFSPSRVELREGQRTDIQVGFYNPHPFNEDWVVKVNGGDGEHCKSGDPESCYTGAVTATYRNLPFSLEKDQSVGWFVIFEADNGAVDTISEGATSTAALFTIQICVPDGEGDDCDTDQISYQKELFMTIRR